MLLHGNAPIRKLSILFAIMGVLLNCHGGENSTPEIKHFNLSYFNKEFNIVLDNLMTNYWSDNEPGYWRHDNGYEAGNCSDFDASRYGAEFLFLLGLEQNNKLYQNRAKKIIGHVIPFFDQITHESVSKLPALIFGYKYSYDETPFDFEFNLDFLFTTIDYMIEDGSIIGSTNVYSSPSVVTYYQLILADIYMEKGLSETANEMATAAHSVFEIANDYWLAVDEKKGYYNDPSTRNSDNSIYHQGLALMALAISYKLSGDRFYLDRAEKLIAYCEDLWDYVEYGYYSYPGSNYKIFSSNLHMAYGLLNLYDSTENQEYLNKIQNMITFFTSKALIYDERFPDYYIFGHDWNSTLGTTTCACPGCNLNALNLIYQFNDRKANGPERFVLIE